MPTNPKKKNLRERVINAAETCLKQEGSVSVLDVFMGIRFLEPTHFESWKKGMEYIPVLDEWIQCGPEKKQKTQSTFLEWAAKKKLEPFEITYRRNSRSGPSALKLTADGDKELEALYCTKFRSGDLTNAKKQRIENKAKKLPDLLVYIQTGSGSKCSECQKELPTGEVIFLEDGQPLCLMCADMDHLEFLPSGNATLTRRSKKYSQLSAIVLKFNRRRKRYERQGILVTSAAIEQAETQCEADADNRAVQREKAAERRAAKDVQLVADMTQMIVANYPGCPHEEANEIATHTAVRGSGRVGRSAAGRDLDPNAVRLAVEAWVRHQHTNYDALLMKGIERMDARQEIRPVMHKKLTEWSLD